MHKHLKSFYVQIPLITHIHKSKLRVQPTSTFHLERKIAFQQQEKMKEFTRFSKIVLIASFLVMMMLSGQGLILGQTCSVREDIPASFTRCVGITCGSKTSLVFAPDTSSSTTSTRRVMRDLAQPKTIISGSLSIDVGCPCNPSTDIGARFSQCDNATNTKSAFYFFKPPAVCTGYELPPPVHGIPCDLQCEEGTHLDVDTKTCQHCDAGSYAHSGELTLNSWLSTGTTDNVGKFWLD